MVINSATNFTAIYEQKRYYILYIVHNFFSNLSKTINGKWLFDKTFLALKTNLYLIEFQNYIIISEKHLNIIVHSSLYNTWVRLFSHKNQWTNETQWNKIMTAKKSEILKSIKNLHFLVTSCGAQECLIK